jgi:hypothetical protein
MFNFFKKKSKKEVLEEKYKKLMQESFELSTSNRSEADKKYVEAEAVMIEIEKL